jgi:hypothetical protein
MRRVTKREQVAEVITNFDAFPKVHDPNHHRSCSSSVQQHRK